MSNMQIFDFCALRIFDALYDAFPLKIDLNTVQLLGELPFSERENAELAKIITHSIKWLENEGFISVDSADIGGKSFVGVGLTYKGLASLKRTPKSLNTPVAVAVKSACKELVKTGTSESIAQAVGLLFR